MPCLNTTWAAGPMINTSPQYLVSDKEMMLVDKNVDKEMILVDKNVDQQK